MRRLSSLVLAVAVCSLIGAGTAFPAFDGMEPVDDNALFATALDAIQQGDLSSGFIGMSRFVGSPTAQASLKAEAYLWMGFVEINDGKKKRARDLLREMFRSDLGADISLSALPPALARNTELMELYDKERERYLKATASRSSAAATRKLEEARKLYESGRSFEAEENVAAYLRTNPSDYSALELKQKISAQNDAAYDEIYRKAVEHIELSELDLGYQGMSRVSVSSAAPADVKAEAFLWMAFVEIQEGRRKAAEQTVRDMFRNNIGLNYDIINLPSTLSSNMKLMEIYWNSKYEFSRFGKKNSQKSQRLLHRAKTLYLMGRLSESEELFNYCLQDDPENLEARSYIAKMDEIRRRIMDVRKRLVEDLYMKAEHLYKSGNTLDALSQVQKAINIDPGYQRAVTLFLDAYKNVSEVVKGANLDDQKRFQRAVQSYLAGNYQSSVNDFRKLQPYIPGIEKLLSVSVMHLADEANAARALSHFRDALTSMKHRRFKNAQASLYLALELDKDYYNAWMMLEQINVELGSLR